MKQRTRNLALLFLGLFVLFLLLCLSYRFLGFAIPCPLYSLTGLYCPGCGSFRAAYSLLQLKPAAAFGYNAFFMLLLPFLALASARSALAYWQGRQLKTGRWELVLSIGFISLGVLFGILRNIPAFAFLAPGGA